MSNCQTSLQCVYLNLLYKSWMSTYIHMQSINTHVFLMYTLDSYIILYLYIKNIHIYIEQQILQEIRFKQVSIGTIPTQKHTRRYTHTLATYVYICTVHSTHIYISLRMHLCSLQQSKQNNRYNSKPSSCTKIWKNKVTMARVQVGRVRLLQYINFHAWLQSWKGRKKTATLTLSGISNKLLEDSRAVSPNTCLRRTP